MWQSIAYICLLLPLADIFHIDNHPKYNWQRDLYFHVRKKLVFTSIFLDFQFAQSCQKLQISGRKNWVPWFPLFPNNLVMDMAVDGGCSGSSWWSGYCAHIDIWMEIIMAMDFYIQNGSGYNYWYGYAGMDGGFGWRRGAVRQNPTRKVLQRPFLLSPSSAFAHSFPALPEGIFLVDSFEGISWFILVSFFSWLILVRVFSINCPPVMWALPSLGSGQ